ncbi:MAG: methylated-DNA--[protein]-cysteine S-methyltransferase [Clostridiales bacterium]|nr:methylated-DNA--[protein]-cysteine S-methyltransferase [Clostridiales bacterium]
MWVILGFGFGVDISWWGCVLVERRSVETVMGVVNFAFSGDGLYELTLPREGDERFSGVVDSDPEWVRRLGQDLQDYFSGSAVCFSCPVDMSGYAPFIKKALLAAAEIFHGHVETYKGLAVVAGSPRAARAVGQAMASNRTPLVIPCHRVVCTGGGLGGFSGGLGWKERLLALEKPREDVNTCG